MEKSRSEIHYAEQTPTKRHMLRTTEANAVQRILIELYGVSIALLFYFLTLFGVVYSRIRVHGREHIPLDSPVVFCCWHESVLMAHGAFYPSYRHRLTGRKIAWMVHPAWIFHCTTTYLKLMGVSHVAFGTKGQSGRRAADQLVDLLSAGISVFMIPDGPVPGPPRQLKKGVLHVAMQSGAPVVPIRFSVRRCLRLWQWDRKFYPTPFCRIDVHIGEPLRVTENNFEQRLVDINRALG